MTQITKNPAQAQYSDPGPAASTPSRSDDIHAHAKSGSSSTTSVAETDPSDPGDVASLTPDALMAYCQSRLDSLDSQMNDIFDTQQSNAKTTNDLNKIASSLNDLPTDNSSPPKVQFGSGRFDSLVTEYHNAIHDAGGPKTQLGAELQQDLHALQGYAAKHDMTSDNVSSLSQNLKNYSSALNSDSELTMINLQSLMSQRQTAVQLTTNLVQSLGEQSSDIAKNIGQ